MRVCPETISVIERGVSVGGLPRDAGSAVRLRIALVNLGSNPRASLLLVEKAGVLEWAFARLAGISCKEASDCPADSMPIDGEST